MNKKLIALIVLALQGSILASKTVEYTNNNSDTCCQIRRPASCPTPTERSVCNPRKYSGRRWRDNGCCERRSSRRARGWNSSNYCPSPRKRPACCPQQRYCRPKPACCTTSRTIAAKKEVPGVTV